MATSLSSQGIWQALASPIASSINKMISTTDKKLFISMPYSGIQYSEDLGSIWISKNEGLDIIQSYPIMIAGPNGSVFIATDDDIYKLKSIHSNWEKVNYAGKKITGMYTSPNNRVFCISEKIVYISDDEGLNFKQFFESPNKYVAITQLSYNGNGNNYFVDFVSGASRLYKFDDVALQLDSLAEYNNDIKNLIWHPDNKLFLTVSSAIYLFNENSKQLEEVKLNQSSSLSLVGILVKDPFNNLICLANESYLSKDAGENWTPLNKQVWPTDYANRNSTFIDSFLFVSSDYCTKPLLNRFLNFDSNQTDLSNRFTQPTAYTFIKDPSEQIFVSTCRYSNIKQTFDEGKSWTNFKVFGKEAWILCKGKLNKYFAVCSDSTYTSIDFGKTWTALSYQLPHQTGVLFVSLENDLYYPYGWGTFIRTNEDGSDMKYLSLPCCDGGVSNMLFHPSGRIYIFHLGQLFYSDDKGDQFKNDKNFIIRTSFSSFNYEMTNLGDIYCISMDSLFFVDYNLSNKYLIEPLSKNSKLLGHDNFNNVFVFDPLKGLRQCNKSSCRQFDMTGLPYPYMFIKTIYSDENNFLYAGLYNDKIYKYNEPVVSTKDPISKDSETIKVFPNPFSSSLNVDVLKSKTGSYHVVVQDIFGRTIFNAIEQQSNFKIETESIRPGIYFIRVNDSGYRKIIKI